MPTEDLGPPAAPASSTSGEADTPARDEAEG